MDAAIVRNPSRWWQRGGSSRYRYFPLVCEEFVDAEGNADAELRPATALDVPLVLNLGFFGALGPSLDDARGALSFMTIFA